MVQHVHHFELIHHPKFVLTGTVHHFGSKIASREAIRHHHRVNSGCIWLDAAVQPPIFGLGLFHNVMAALIGLNGHNLLNKVSDALSAAPDFLASVVKLVKTYLIWVKFVIDIRHCKALEKGGNLKRKLVY